MSHGIDTGRFDISVEPRGIERPRVGRIALALGGLAYAAEVLVASANAGPRGWGLHSAGFLPLPLRFFVLALLVGGWRSWCGTRSRGSRTKG